MKHSRLFPLFLFGAICSFSPFRELFFVPSIGELILLAVIPFVMLAVMMARPEYWPRFPLFAIPFLALSFLSVGFQIYEVDLVAFKQSARFVGAGTIFFWCWLWLRSTGEQGQRELHNCLIALGFVMSLVCILQMFLGPNTSDALMPWGPEWTTSYVGLGFRTYGLLDNPLLAGSLMTVCLPFALVRLKAGFQKRYWLISLCTAAGILFTGSRSCLVVAALISGLQFLPRLRLSGVIFAILPVLAMVAAVLATPFASRFEDLLTPGGDSNLSNRVWASLAAGEMVADSPWLGVGPGLFAESYGHDYKPVYGQQQESAYTPDNLILQVAAETGLPAALLALAGYLYILSRAHRRRHAEGEAATYALIAYGMLSLGVVLYATPIMWLLMVLFAMVECFPKQEAEASTAIASV